MAVALQGKVQNYTLVNAANEAMERALTDVTFAPQDSKLPVTTIASEEELQSFLRRPEAVRITARVPLPRIVYGSIYWPPSERVMNILRERQETRSGSWTPESLKFMLDGIEGTDLQTIWEPIAKDHPAHQWMKEPRH